MMTKEAIYRLVDALDEEEARTILAFMQEIVGQHHATSEEAGRLAAQPHPIEWMKIGRPTSEDDPLWNIVGIIDEHADVPTDLAANHDRYLAEIYADRHES